MPTPSSVPSHTNRVRKDILALAGFATVLYLALAGMLFREILQRNGGQFTYALDDPYIHLALSEGIAHGHYGINAGEAASPSSSAIWPLLLAPFAQFSWQAYVPLILNLLAGIATAILIGTVVALWPSPVEEGVKNAARITETWRRLLSVVGLVFIGNLLGLTFIGMEHTLQVFLAGVGAWGIICCLRGRSVPAWVLVCSALAPLVRYESLAISVGLAIALAGRRLHRRAAVLLFCSVLPLVLFSFFLHGLGLPWVPTSVLVKGQSRIAVADAVLHKAKAKTAVAPLAGALPAMNAKAGPTEAPRTAAPGSPLAANPETEALLEPHRLLLTILTVTLFAIAWNERVRERRFALFGAAAAGALHLLIGRFNWFHRYEVYVVFFCAMVVLYVVHERPRGVLGWYVLGLLGCSYLYVQAFHDVPRSAGDVYREEFQMHRFATEFYTGNVAVNDLGWVSYHRRPGTYILDLWGLGSVEAARQHDKSTAWLDAVTRAHHVDLVMNYALWFAPPPPDWTLLGEVCLNQMPVALGDPCVNYYATNAAAVPALQAEFHNFAATLPPGTVVRHPVLPPPPPVDPVP